MASLSAQLEQLTLASGGQTQSEARKKARQRTSGRAIVLPNAQVQEATLLHNIKHTRLSLLQPKQEEAEAEEQHSLACLLLLASCSKWHKSKKERETKKPRAQNRANRFVLPPKGSNK